VVETANTVDIGNRLDVEYENWSHCFLRTALQESA
jgi:hypothetical protein